MVKKVWLLLIVCVFCITSGCTGKKSEFSSKTQIPQFMYLYPNNFVVDNTTPIEELLTQKYALSSLEEFFGVDTLQGSGFIENTDALYLSWAEVDLSFPVQCIRHNRNVHYSVYDVTEGGRYFVFWMVPFADAPVQIEGVTAIASVYINKLSSKQMFADLKRGISTAQDVRMLDQSMELDFFSSLSTPSYSLLNNGQILKVTYSFDKLDSYDDLIVEDMKVCKKGEVSSKLSTIFDFDLP